MSYNFRNIREQSNSPLEKEVSDIAKKVAAGIAKQQFDTLDDKEDIFPSGVDDDVVVKFHDELVGVNKFTFDKIYQPTFEPDYDKVTLLLKGKSLGNQLRDYSGYGNHATIYGEPVLVDGGPFNPGLFDNGVKSIATRYNRPTSEYENLEYMEIPDAPSLRVNGLTTGISIMFFFRVFDLAPEAGFTRTFYKKVDDTTTPTNGLMIQYDSTGHLIFIIKRAGNEYRGRTPASRITVNTVYGAFITYAVSGNAIHIYTWVEDGTPNPTVTDNTLTDPGAATWPLTTTNVQLMRRSSGNNGYAYADFYKIIMYREMVVSSTQVSNFARNKITILDRDLGTCMVTNHATTLGAIAMTTSFTSGSFSGTSFDVL